MDIKEFNAKRVRTEDRWNVYLEVRPLGDRQGEAIDLYLHEALASLQIG